MKAQDIPTALALGLGVMKGTDLLKEVFDRATGMALQPYLKSLIATGLSVGAAVTYTQGWRERVLLASAVAGASAVMHEGYASLSTKADGNKLAFLQTAARRGGGRIPPL